MGQLNGSKGCAQDDSKQNGRQGSKREQECTMAVQRHSTQLLQRAASDRIVRGSDLDRRSNNQQ